MDYANTTNVESIIDAKVLFHGWLIHSYFAHKLIKWLPGESADWFFEIIMTWSYCLPRRYSMSRQKNNILINEYAPNREPVPLKDPGLYLSWTFFASAFSSLFYFTSFLLYL